jgi:lipopolysaccharide export system ATP-binding protein
MSRLDVNSLSKTLGKRPILRSISCYAHEGEVVALLGPNGAGKTTLLRSIMGLSQTPPVQAAGHNTISFDGHIINTWPAHKRVAHGLVYLPQQTSLINDLSVADNLNIVYQYHTWWRDKSRSVFDAETAEWLERIQLTSALQSKAGVLSGGQKRKLEVVRSILLKPRILLLDEPFAGVDPKSIYELKELLLSLATQKIGIVISDHHVDQLLAMASRMYVIVAGEVVAQGTSQEILENSYTKERYLGTQFYQEMTQRFSSTP